MEGFIENTQWKAKGFWQREQVHWPRPVLPLFVSYLLEPVEVGSKQAYEEWSFPIERQRYLVINGYVFQRTDLFGGELPPIMQRLPWMFNLWRINTKVRKRFLEFDQFVGAKGFERHVASWKDSWEPEAWQRLMPLKKFDRQKASFSQLADHLDACYDYLCWSWGPHFKTVLVSMYIRQKWEDLCVDLFNLTSFEAYELVQTNDSTVFSLTNRITQMAKRAATDPIVANILRLPAKEAMDQLQETWFEKEIAEFLDAEGDRAVDSFELDPTWREMPELVIGVVKEFMTADSTFYQEENAFQEYRHQRMDDLVKTLVSQEEKDEFLYWFKLAEQAYLLTESHDYVLTNIPTSLARYDALETGKRLVEEGYISQYDHTLYLYREELTEVLREWPRKNKSLKELIASRQVEHTKNHTLKPPNQLGTPPLDPPWEVFPENMASALKIFMKQMAQVETQKLSTNGIKDGELNGTPGSPGIALGPVSVVLTAEEFSKVKTGDILVCPFTTPSWTVLFPKVAGLITDSGGALSHASIVAREYGIPSVVGTVTGTKDLKDGQLVSVDGSIGIVKVL